MIELRTLGVLDLRGADGYELRPILQQPKRLALLAFLAVSHPWRFHRRDTLLGMFWPELDAEHARAALRRSLYVLRRTLGDGVIVGRGDEEVGLSASDVYCDAAAFEQALAEGRAADALALYRGPLLPGFYITGAPEFERWLDEARRRLHDRAAAATWSLADSAEAQGDRSEAVRWARSAAALSPYDESAHRRLLLTLDRAGDRPAALRAHDEFVRRLRADYDLEPSPETRELAASLRPARPSVSTPAGGQAVLTNATERTRSPTVIAVLPFVFRGNRDYAYLGDGMVDLLGTTLDGAGDYRTVDARALLAYVAREGLAESRDGVDLERARAVAEHFGAGLLLLGSIVEVGGRVRIRAQLYESATAGSSSVPPVASADVAGVGESGIFDMVDSLTRQLLAGRSTRPADRFSRLAALTTESVPALKAYLRGECDFRAGRYLQALEAFQNATAEDPSFALAYYRLAGASAAVANLEVARDASAQAHLNRGRLSEHDRLLLDAQHAWLRGAADDAERLYTAVLGTHVDDMEAWFLLGDLLFHHNPLRGRSLTEARAAFERALRYDSQHLSSLVHLARIAALEGRRDELYALVDRVLKLSPAGDRALSMRALRAFALGNEIEKARVLTALTRARALTVGIAFTDIVLYARDVGGAQRIARLLAKVVRAPEERALCHLVLAHLELSQGRLDRARTELALAARTRAADGDPAWALEIRALFAVMPFVPTSDDELLEIREDLRRWDAASERPRRNQVLAVHNGLHHVLRDYLIGLVSARVGDAASACAAAELLERARSHPNQHFARMLAAGVRASAAASEGHAREALALLERARPELWYQHTVTSPVFSRAYDRYLRAELLTKCGRAGEALRWYQTLGESSPYELVYVAPAHFRQAQIYDQAGDHDLAVHHYERCAKLWKGCDERLKAVPLDARSRAEALRGP
jgi:DNA-binding SARP family transcriptional activator/TolB-like protein